MSEPRPGALALKLAAGTSMLAVLFAILSAVLGERAPASIAAADSNSAVGSAAYQDRFVSGEEENFRLTGTARLRDLPTTGGSSVIGTFSAGDLLSGKRVVGANGSSQWVRIDRGGSAGYLWTGNLEIVPAASEPAVDAPSGASSGAEGQGAETTAAPPAAPVERPAEFRAAERRTAAAGPVRKAPRRAESPGQTGAADGISCLLPLGQQARMSADECTRQGGVTME